MIPRRRTQTTIVPGQMHAVLRRRMLYHAKSPDRTHNRNLAVKNTHSDIYVVCSSKVSIGFDGVYVKL